MKPLKTGLRIWIAITSVLSFLGGWVLLSHAPKPAPLIPSTSSSSQAAAVASPAQLPTLAPLPPITTFSDMTTGTANLQPLPSTPQINLQQSFAPRFRTRGS